VTNACEAAGVSTSGYYDWAERRAAGPTPRQLAETELPAEQPAVRPAERPKASAAQHHKEGALALLALLQREGRLVDFLTEAIDDAPDDAIGAAVREVHRGCRKVFEQYLTMEPVMPGEEGARAQVPKGFDPASVATGGRIPQQCSPD
jgi:hypothetical protein